MRTKRFVWLATACFVCLAFAGTASADANRDVSQAGPDPAVRSVGHYSTLGFDPVQRAIEMNESLLWLQSERGIVTPTPGISVELTDDDRRNIGELPCDDCDGTIKLRPTLLRVGVVKAVAPAVTFEGITPRRLSHTRSFAGGTLRTLADGFVWTLTAESREAAGLRIQFTNFDLPEGVEIWVYSDEGLAFGPYTGTGWNDDGEFWSHGVGGSTAYVQLRYSGEITAERMKRIRFEIPQVAHLGSRAWAPTQSVENPVAETNAFCGFNASCIQNAGTLGGAFGDAQSGIAFMRWISGAFVNICSGGLIADTDGSSQVPLFLTANHCINKGKDAKNLEAFFRYATRFGSSCPSNPYFDDPGVQSVLGANILSTSSTSDYTLMQLKQNPPSGSYFLPFDSTPVANSNGVPLHRISHPGGAPQAYSTQDVDTGAGTCQNIARGNWIYSRDTSGGTEGGSSGSPVLNASGAVVGQLTGACGTNTGNPCDSVNNATIDGALAAYYASVAEWLDPDGGGDPPGGSCDNDGTCESGEDCTNCNDCPGKTNGPPSGRYCCGDGTAQGPEGDGSICDGNY